MCVYAAYAPRMSPASMSTLSPKLISEEVSSWMVGSGLSGSAEQEVRAIRARGMYQRWLGRRPSRYISTPVRAVEGSTDGGGQRAELSDSTDQCGTGGL